MKKDELFYQRRSSISCNNKFDHVDIINLMKGKFFIYDLILSWIMLVELRENVN